MCWDGGARLKPFSLTREKGVIKRASLESWCPQGRAGSKQSFFFQNIDEKEKDREIPAPSV